jgi:hypothetical protein
LAHTSPGQSKLDACALSVDKSGIFPQDRSLRSRANSIEIKDLGLTTHGTGRSNYIDPEQNPESEQDWIIPWLDIVDLSTGMGYSEVYGN